MTIIGLSLAEEINAIGSDGKMHVLYRYAEKHKVEATDGPVWGGDRIEWRRSDGKRLTTNDARHFEDDDGGSYARTD